MKANVLHEFSVLRLDGTSLSTEDLHQEGERLMGALLDLEEVNPDVAGVATTSDASRGVVGAEMVVEAETADAAFEKSRVIVRTAICAIGGRQTDWVAPDHTESKFDLTALQLEMI